MPIAKPIPGANALRAVSEVGPMVIEKNVDIPMSDGGLVRANVYRPKTGRHPVLMTYGPYGKDIPYAAFHGPSYSQIPEGQRSANSAWETPHPEYWTGQGYVVVRADERGTGASPGFLDCAYYAATQWGVAARQPRGLACIVPWEGMCDAYRDKARHGGIFSNTFLDMWWKNQVGCMQYGNGTKITHKYGPWEGPEIGPECLEGELSADELAAARRDPTVDNKANRFLDDEHHHSREYSLADIEVPVLSVANLGGIMLHLRGNVLGYMGAGSKNKWLYFISGRHDLPFYLPHYVELQKSFLDAWLKDIDPEGWKAGPNVNKPAVSLLVRKGNLGFNSATSDGFTARGEFEWPLARTEYRQYNLTSRGQLTTAPATESGTFEIPALGKGTPATFEVTFDAETEIAGHATANLVFSINKRDNGTAPRDMDVFVSLRHIGADGKEIYYTGTVGDPVPLAKGWLRGSLRAINEKSPRHHEYLPFREYRSTDVSYLEPGTKYALLVEIWPTAVVVEKGAKIVLEVATGDTLGSGIFLHNDPEDRSEKDFAGVNVLHVGGEDASWVKLPVV